MDVELGDDQQRRRPPSTVAPRPETRPASGQQRGSRDGGRCNVLVFMLVLLGAVVGVGIWVLAIIGLGSLLGN